MKILYDHQIFETQKVGGISRYCYELLYGLARFNDVVVELSLKHSPNEYLKNSQFSKKIEPDPDNYENFLQGREFIGKWSLFNLRKIFRRLGQAKSGNVERSIAALKKQEFDIFHPTYYDDYFLPYLGGKPFVLTVHDMIHDIYPEHFNLSDQTSIKKRNLALLATKIITVSECTKIDLIQFYGIPPDKVEVIHLACSKYAHESENVVRPAMPARFLLYVGTRSGYKNFYFFLNSIGRVLKADPTLHVVCAGTAFSDNEMAFIMQHEFAARVHSFSVTDAVLWQLYKRALALVFPSLYEGFGLPVLEAFGLDCPAILSNSGSLPEIGGEAAIYFYPKDANSIQAAISKTIYGSEQFRRNLVVRGNLRAQQFSWENTCRQTEKVYRQILEELP